MEGVERGEIKRLLVLEQLDGFLKLLRQPQEKLLLCERRGGLRLAGAYGVLSPSARRDRDREDELN